MKARRAFMSFLGHVDPRQRAALFDIVISPFAFHELVRNTLTLHM